MKNILLLHGFASTSQSYFLPWLKQKYSPNFQVFSPDLPTPFEPHVDEWTKIIENLPSHDFEMVIAHSLGGTFALSLLTREIIKAKHVVMIGSSPGPKDNQHMNTFLKYQLDFEEIKKNGTKITTVQSFDDPWTFPEYGILNVKHSRGAGIFYGDQGHFETSELPEEVQIILDRFLGV